MFFARNIFLIDSLYNPGPLTSRYLRQLTGANRATCHTELLTLEGHFHPCIGLRIQLRTHTSPRALNQTHDALRDSSHFLRIRSFPLGNVKENQFLLEIFCAFPYDAVNGKRILE